MITACILIIVPVRSLQLENTLNSADQFSVTVSLNEICRSGENYTVIVFFGIMELGNSNCELRQSLRANVVPGGSEMFVVNTCSLTLKPGQEYCYIAALEGDAGELNGKRASQFHVPQFM